jgi:hypothetical protein
VNELGKTVFHKTVEPTANNFEMIIPAESYSAGIYVLQIIGSNSSQSIKISKNK